MSQYPWSHEARYDQAKLIAEGGMGAVYSARDAKLERTVAIKVISSVHRQHIDFRKRMKREISALSKLEHPNIVRLYECNEGPTGELYFTMEYVPGIALNDYVKKRKLSARKVVTLFLSVLDAISALHKAKIIHRDIKAANVLITDDARVKLIDLGLACFENNSATPLTKTNQVVGTLAYLPPEVCQGGSYTEQSDIFQAALALDLTLRDKSGYRIKEYPDELAEIVDRALSDNPQERQPSIDALHQDLSNWLKRPPSRPVSKVKAKNEQRHWVAFLLFLTSLLALCCFYFLGGSGEAISVLGVRLQSPKRLLLLFKGSKDGALFIKLGNERKKRQVDLSTARSLDGGQKALEVILSEPIINEVSVEITTPTGHTKHQLNGRHHIERLIGQVDNAVKANNHRLTTRLGHLAFAFSQIKGNVTEKRKNFQRDMLEVLAEEGVQSSTIDQLKEYVQLYLRKDGTIFSPAYRRCQSLATIETALAMCETLPPPWGRITNQTQVQFGLVRNPFPLDDWQVIWEKELIKRYKEGERWCWLSPPVAPSLALTNMRTVLAAADFGGKGGEAPVFERGEWLPKESEIKYQIDLAGFSLLRAKKYALLLDVKFFHRSGVMQIILSNGQVGELFNTSCWELPPTNFVYRRKMYWLVPIKEEEMKDVNHIKIKVRRIPNFGTLPILAFRQVKLLALK